VGVEAVEVRAHVLERPLGQRLIKALACDPLLVGSRPGPLARAEDAPVAQQLLGDAVAGGAARADQIIAAAHQVPQALLRGRRRRDNVSSPARNSPASFLASRRSVLTRSPALTSTSDGATRSQATPIPRSSRSRS
jgi:hypothetical protein